MSSRDMVIAKVMYQHTVTCCEVHVLMGKSDGSYICRVCGKEAVVVGEQVRSGMEAEFIVDNLKCKCGGYRSIKTLECDRCEEVLDLDSDS